jgi:hypothetical protein
MSGGEDEVSGSGEEGTEEEFARLWGGWGEELDEAAIMSSTGSRDELRDEGHDGEDDDGGEELNKAAAMILIDGGDDLDEVRGRAVGWRWLDLMDGFTMIWRSCWKLPPGAAV